MKNIAGAFSGVLPSVYARYFLAFIVFFAIFNSHSIQVDMWAKIFLILDIFDLAPVKSILVGDCKVAKFSLI